MDLAGHNGQAALAAIVERHRRWRAGDRHPDGRKIGLVVEGGAMRGVRSAGGLLALETLGLTDVFDEVYGTSAGAFNAAYFLAGQAALAASIYYQDLNDSRFINLLRPRKVVDVDYVLDIIRKQKALRVDKVMSSHSKLFVPLLDACSGEAFLVHAQGSNVPLLTLLRASGALPIGYNHTVEVDGRPCLDAGWANIIPVRSAIERQCTDVLVLLTQPKEFREPDPGWFERCAFNLAGYWANENMRRTFLRFSKCANDLRDLALGRSSTPPPLNIATITPAQTDTAVGSWTKDASRLKAAVDEYAAGTLQAFLRHREPLAETACRPLEAPHRFRLDRQPSAATDFEPLVVERVAS